MAVKDHHFVASLRRVDSIGIFYLIHHIVKCDEAYSDEEVKDKALSELHAQGYEINFITKPEKLLDNFPHL